MTTTTLKKWGNSQGIILPKAICDLLGWSIDDKIEIHPDSHGNAILSVSKRKFERTKNLTMAEIFEGYEGVYPETEDLYDENTHEFDWGSPVGKELW